MDIQIQHFYMYAKTEPTIIYTSHAIGIFGPATNMPFNMNIYRLVHVHISHNSVSINTSCELNANNMIRNTPIHTFHIIGICP